MRRHPQEHQAVQLLEQYRWDTSNTLPPQGAMITMTAALLRWEGRAVCPEEAAGCVTNTCSNRITSKLQSVVSTSVEAKFTETKTAVCRWVKTVQSIKHKIYAASCVLNLVWIRLKCVIAHVQPFQPLFFKYVSRMRLISWLQQETLKKPAGIENQVECFVSFAR